MTMQSRAALCVLALSLGAVAPGAQAQANWPAKPVKFIVGFPPGGSTDQVARVLAAELTAKLGQQFIVDNRPGASASIGAAAVASAPPDGTTFGVVFDTHAVNPSVIPNLPFNTTKDLAPVMLTCSSPRRRSPEPSPSARSARAASGILRSRRSATSSMPTSRTSLTGEAARS
jgi:tripartite-type tricarboxylate transporter receptor subunit TctC